MNSPYRASAKSIIPLGNRWGATLFVKLVIRIARFLQIPKYHKVNHFDRVDEKGNYSPRGELICHRTWIPSCWCKRCTRSRIRNLHPDRASWYYDACNCISCRRNRWVVINHIIDKYK